MSPALSDKRRGLLWPVTLHDAAFVSQVRMHLQSMAPILANMSTACLKKHPLL